MRHRKTDAHIATIRVSVPIDPMNVATIEVAHAAINGLRAHLPAGSTVEVLNSRFGRVDAPQIVTQIAPAMAEAQLQFTQSDISDALKSLNEQIHNVTAGAMPEPEIPDSLRRVPRHVPNGG